MFEKIKNFFSNTWVQLALLVAPVVYFLTANNFSRPPIKAKEGPLDYSEELSKLDPTKPIGVYIFTVEHKPGIISTNVAVNASRNNYIETMREQYGDNIIVLDNPKQNPQQHLDNFAKKFNEKFGSQNPEVHFVANHHQNTYDDKKLSAFFNAIEGKNKRALVLACGPKREDYSNTELNYVIIPRADGQLLGPEIDLEVAPAYRYAIKYLKQYDNPEDVHKKFEETNLDSIGSSARDWLVTNIGYRMKGKTPPEYTPPVVVEPPKNIPLSKESAKQMC